MRKSSSARKRQQNDFELLRGGTLAESVARRHFEAVKKAQVQDISTKFAIRQQAAKSFAKIRPSSVSDDSAAIDGLRAITVRLAKQKLAQPRRNIVPPFGAWGSYALRFTPPYTSTSSAGHISDVTGDPAITASRVDSLGQLRCSVATDFDRASSGTASSRMGVYFRPMFSDATVRVSCDYDITYSWYANSIRDKEADCYMDAEVALYFSSASILPAVTMRRFDGRTSVSVAALNTLRFDFGSVTGPTIEPLEAKVSSSRLYLVVVSLTCQASGAGWPGSLAGASAIVTVPSITLTVTANIGDQLPEGEVPY